MGCLFTPKAAKLIVDKIEINCKIIDIEFEEGHFVTFKLQVSKKRFDRLLWGD